MFTHPALLRQLNQAAELLRRGGETAWARRLVQAADQLRKLGWTAEARTALMELFDGQYRLEAVSFGSEHERRLGGPQGCAEANARLAELRQKIRELASHPLRDAPDPE